MDPEEIEKGFKQLSFTARLPEIAIIGCGCRLPGADDPSAFARLLEAGRNVVSERPIGRWSVERFLRRGAPEPGFAYTFAGGYLNDPLAFDPAPFGISPREAQQMDPQQRVLLETTWRALEDANITASSLAGRDVGVYIGASTVDYQSGASHDPAVMGSHFMTGNSLSILANRISYTFDLRGPSFTVDSACSSSFVALVEAVNALRSGRIEFAIVGGVNLLLSPAPFIGFSQARMLSPTGLSRPFSNQADGYVRAEGAVVLVLRKFEDAYGSGNRIRSVIVGASVNSDGRTSGISLPSVEGQETLIRNLYSDIGLAPEALAFVEAHGTGTKVGDPIEARAIGAALGQCRSRPLPIGSVKSNIGHLEAASGLAGLLKASLALEHRRFPQSVLCDVLNEDIDFKALNLAPAQSAIALDKNGNLHAGICNYGFGGTNAHVVLRSTESPDARSEIRRARASSRLLVISAASRPALVARTAQIARSLVNGAQADDVASALGRHRDLLSHRLVGKISDPHLASRLARFSSGKEDVGLATGIAQSTAQRIVFVYSGNGSQYSNMGRRAYLSDATFRREIDEIDAAFTPRAGWSISSLLRAGVEAERLQETSTSQPLIFAIQSALTRVLASCGLLPDAVLGHSVGEVAAAEASGALPREDALCVIHERSKHQEAVRGRGRMLVAAADAETLAPHLAAFPNIEIAALNGPSSTTLSGPNAALDAFVVKCRRRRIATIDLGIPYPFHSAALDELRDALEQDLSQIVVENTLIPFYSTVTGGLHAGKDLGPSYWWENIRRPVLFESAVSAALDDGETVFIEISPRPILSGALRDIMRLRGKDERVVVTLSPKDEELHNPIDAMLARLVAQGLELDPETIFGSPPASRIALPGYPFQRQYLALPDTHEAILAFGRMNAAKTRHPLLGARMAEGSPEWRTLLDPLILPILNDHRVDGACVLPAAAMIEMAVAAGRDLFGDEPLEIVTFDILRPLVFPQGETREVSTRHAAQTEIIEIWSRPRFAGEDGWILHARGAVRAMRLEASKELQVPSASDLVHVDAERVYAEAARAGLAYGPAFRLVREIAHDRNFCVAWLNPPSDPSGAFPGLQGLHPASLDAAFHGLFVLRPNREGETKAHLPIRFRAIRVMRYGAEIRRVAARLTHETDRSKTIEFRLYDTNNQLIASADAAVFRSMIISQASVNDRAFHESAVSAGLAKVDDLAWIAPSPESRQPVPQRWLLFRAFALSLAGSVLTRIADDQNSDLTSLVERGLVAKKATPCLEAAQALMQQHSALIEGGAPGAIASKLPEPTALLAAFLRRFPNAQFETRMAAFAIHSAEDFLRMGAHKPASAAMLERLSADAAPAQSATAELGRIIDSLCVNSERPHLLVLEPFSRGLTRLMRPFIEAGRANVTFATSNEAALAQLREEFARDLGADVMLLGEDPLGLRFDGLISFVPGSLPERFDQLLTRAAACLRATAPGIIAFPAPDLAFDFLTSPWRDFPSSGENNSSAFTHFLKQAGFVDIETQATANGLAEITLARKRAEESNRAVANRGVAFFETDSKTTARFGYPGAPCFNKEKDGELVSWLGDQDEPIILVSVSRTDCASDLAKAIEMLKKLLEQAIKIESRSRIFVVTEGATNAIPSPGSTAIRGFLRVAVNEYSAIDLRLIEITDPANAGLVKNIVEAPGDEREWTIGRSGVMATRIRRGLEPSRDLAASERSQLTFMQPGRLDTATWVTMPRRPPSPNEIELDVLAIGLNYRDALVGLGLLDDDLLGAGLTSASLGFECAGRVLRVGADVTTLSPGDLVTGFAAGALSSRVTAHSWQFFRCPEGLSPEASATIPVAFATAWHALVECARLRKGETVLIHGAAGGVGLAAISIAKHIGARIIGTASDPARRAIAKAAGADFVCDSRNERFVEAIRAESEGVDVVLNSLAGSAMQASFDLMKPFGRFIELGKRDFLDNSQMALRPFLRNRTYCGVDLDECLAHDPAGLRQMMSDLLALFANGALRPLPHQVYEAAEANEAFRALQTSEHIGKIILRPASRAQRALDACSFSARPGLYMVVGGTSGLGFETACWLAQHGASQILLVSRRGAVDEQQLERIEKIRASGVEVFIKPLDVTNRDAVFACVRGMTQEHGPLRGVVHAAVQLDDGLISRLEADRLRAVLAAKVDGVRNLEEATQGHDLDHFVVYSSATTLVGSPGQAAYVAANAFLEGWARRRRAQGKPALAIGWGAIADAGIIARDPSLGERLRRTTGVLPIRASEAMAHLGRLLALGDSVDPVQVYSNIASGGAAGKLSLLKSPAFAALGLVGGAETSDGEGDLASLIAGKEANEALSLVMRALRREVAQILRMPEADVDPTRPLGELGLDSLMGLELHLGVEKLCGVQMPMIGAADRQLADIAASLVAQLRGREEPDDNSGMAQALARAHALNKDPLGPSEKAGP